VVDERAAYPDLSRRSEQLLCTKFLHPSSVYFILILKFNLFSRINILF